MLKLQIQQALMTQLNTNTQGVKFVLGKLGQTKNSKFTIETYGTAVGNQLGPKFYELISEEFVPVAVNNFDAVYLFDNQFKRRTYVGKFSFLIDEQKQDAALEAIDDFIEDLVGKNDIIGNFSLFFEPQDVRFIRVVELNDIKFLEFELSLTIQVAENAIFGSEMGFEFKLNSKTNYSGLRIITYVPVRSNQTVPVQKIGTNSSKSVVQASSWSATLEFQATIETGGVVRDLIEQLEDSTTSMNQLYDLRVTNPITNKSYTKTVVVSSITTPIQRGNVITMTITVEEANVGVI